MCSRPVRDTSWAPTCFPSRQTDAFIASSDRPSSRCTGGAVSCTSAADVWRRTIERARAERGWTVQVRSVADSKPSVSSARCVAPVEIGLKRLEATSEEGSTVEAKDGDSGGSGGSAVQTTVPTPSDHFMALVEEEAYLKSEIARISGLNSVMEKELGVLAREGMCTDDGLHVGLIDMELKQTISQRLAEQTDPAAVRSDDLTRLASDLSGEDDIEQIMEQSIQEMVDDHPMAVSSRRLIIPSNRSWACPVKVLFFMVALVVPVGVLITKSTEWDKDFEIGLRVAPTDLVLNTSYCILAAGLLALTISLCQQPLILGYLLGGVLVGSKCGLDIVQDVDHISDFSSLGLVFLLFMIGLELDVGELLKMGKVVILTGLFQFPICACTHYGIFSLLSILGISWGSGPYSTLYVSMSCGISSTMIVVKLLAEMAEMDTTPGRLTVGILIFQDIWAIVVLAIQPDLENPEPLVILKTFGMIAILLIVALLYAKFVMPIVFVKSSRSADLMLVLGLSWCFFVGCFAILPFIGLSLELASLISGVALATFPYSAEFTGKIKYIRDFFITLFFVGLGMQIPVPSPEPIGKALLIAIIVLLVRWLGICCVVGVLGGGARLAAVSTINLSQVSEFALVICSLGMNYNHVSEDTLTILIWTFAFLAIASSYMVGYNYRIYGLLFGCCKRPKAGGSDPTWEDADDADDDEHPDRTIVILGFHKVAAMLLAHMEKHSPNILTHMHVIDRNEGIFAQIKSKGVTCSYGDISSPDVLEHAFHGEARLVICSIPDNMLQSVTKAKECTNERLLSISKKVWPEADVIVTADNPPQAKRLYDQGADYVLRMSRLCAHKLSELAVEHSKHAHHHVGNKAFRGHRAKDEAEMLHPKMLIQLGGGKAGGLAG